MEYFLGQKEIFLFPEIDRVNFFYHLSARIVECIQEQNIYFLFQKTAHIQTQQYCSCEQYPGFPISVRLVGGHLGQNSQKLHEITKSTFFGKNSRETWGKKQIFSH